MNIEELNKKVIELEERIVKLEKVDTYTDDELYNKARELIVKNQRASTSYLQRMFTIGYARASRLIDKLEEDGIVGKNRGSEPREVLVKK